MEEEGLVIEITGPGTARVKTVRSELCAGCGARNVCQSLERPGDMVVEVEDPIGVEVGARVRISLPAGVVLKASFAVYIVPLFSLVAAGVLAQRLTADFLSARAVQMVTAISGFSALAVTFFLLRYFYKKRASTSFRPRITSVL